METTKRACVMLAVPYEREVCGPFFQSWTMALSRGDIEWRPYLIGRTAIHLARDQMVKAALRDTDVDFLVMVDSDQVFSSRVIPRLVKWDVPVVAPVIVQRNGPAIPVAYREVAQDEQGFWRYNPLTYEIAAYLSQFNEARILPPSAVLPAEPDHPPVMEGLPDALREGLITPLLPVDAVGAGMVCIRRDVLEAVQPDPKSGLYFGWDSGGEDFHFMRLIRAAGWGGAVEPGERGHGIFVDRGCLVGHVIAYARAGGDLLEEVRRQDAARQEEEAREGERPPAVPDLLNVLAGDHRGQAPSPHLPLLERPTGGPVWADVQLPHQAEVAA